MYKRKIGIIVISIFVSTLIQAQVTVDFTVDKAQGCGSLQAQFTDQSSSTNGSIVKWEWDMDEGVLSSLQDPGRIFVDIRSYTICLTATDDQGNSGTLCKNNFIEVLSLPIVDFFASPVTGCVPLNVQFGDISQVSNGGIKRMIWGLGGDAGVLDGGPELSDVSSVYTLADDYTVSLTIEDQMGCVNTVSKSELIRAGGIPRPAIGVSDPLACVPPHTSSFSLVPLNMNFDYKWDFGNGQTFVGASPPLQMYNSMGSYDLTLMVADIASGCRDTFYYPDIVRVGLENLPSVNLVESCVNSLFTFKDTSALVGEVYLWDFGDGTTSPKKKAGHRYPQAGCYTVTLTKKIGTCENTVALDFCVNVIERPQLQLAYDKLASCKLPAEFNLSVLNADVTNINWTVGTGSGAVSRDSIKIKTDTFGVIPFVVRARYIPGCLIELADSLFAGDLELSLPGHGFEGCVPFMATVMDSLNAKFDVSAWDWTLSTVPQQLSDVETPVFDINDVGNYDLKLIVQTAEGCSDTVIHQDYLRGGTPPDLTFSADILTTCSDTTILFTTDQTSPANGFFWIFGDGGTSTESSPTYVYGDTGSFTVILISQYNGCPAVDSIVDYITIYAPVAAFTIITDCNAALFALEDNSLAADSVFWEITWNGDPYTTSTQRNPVIALPGTGLFEITQTAWNYNSGCIDYHVDALLYGSPNLDIQFSELAGCAPHVISVTNNTLNVTRWQWFAPGGSISNDTSRNPQIEYKNPGVFNGMRVVVTDEGGCQYDIDLDKVVYVGDVNPYFGDLPLYTCPGNAVLLSDSTISAIPIVEWNWSVGDSLVLASGKDVAIMLDSLGVYNATLEAIDSIGCVGEVTLDTAIIVRDFNLTFSSDTMSCIDADITFKVDVPELGIEYIWSFGNGDTAIGVEANYAYQNDGVYQVCVEVVNSTGCDSAVCRKMEIVTVNADFANDISFSECPPLIVNFQDLSAHANFYEWDFGDNSGTSPLSSPSHVYTSPGVFDVRLIAWLNDQCVDTMRIDSLIRLEGPEGGFFLETDGACLPVTATFIGSSVDLYDYIWDFGNGALDTTSSRVMNDTSMYVYTQAGKYLPRLILIDNAFCKRTLTTQDTIFVYDIEAGEDHSVCSGEIVFIEGTGPKSLSSWIPNPFISDPLLLEFETAPDTTTQYILEMNADQCTMRDTLTVFVEYKAELSAVGDAVCPGDTAFLDAFGDIESYAWFDSQWNMLFSDTLGYFAVVPSLSEVYHVLGFKSVCIPDTADVDVVRHPEIEYTLPKNVIGYPDERVDLPLDLEAPEDYDILWQPDVGLSCVTCVSPSLVIDSSIQFFVNITGKGTACSVRDSISYRVPGQCSDDFVYVPNVFSPNNDGVNDELWIYSKKYSELISFGLYDRWGNTVFSTDNFDTPWDGRINGSEAPSGVYIYALRMRCPINGSVVGYTGDVTLLR